MNPDRFFIGWSWRSARGSFAFIALIAALIVIVMTGAGFVLGSSVDDPGGGHFVGNRTVTGVLVAEPYPILIDGGHAMLLAGGGKFGVQAQATALDGKRVSVDGFSVQRGSIEMLLVWGMHAADGSAEVPVARSLGSWRLTGEICDGKCYSGVMRPGSGLAHKACANVCLINGVPPVLVTTAPVEGKQFLLLAGPDGHAVPDALRDHVAILQRMDGTVERIADLLIFRTDITAAREP